MKRIRAPRAKPGEIKAQWGRPGPAEPVSVVYAHGEGAERGTARLLANLFEGERYRPSLKNFPGYETEKSFLAELEERGYDLTTLKFSIQKKD